ncbi:Peptidyl-prolyl cis-trans isomerase CWC27 like protein [Eufriesea mexicana]|uniref:Peptidyl-prolyl cis-trans isomerase CWC27 like protein n=1 Tax=Eufriesea mexicana TaxID=516756 RepID=A0A310S8E9_9HYME|nr:Peptidyl-prolyl cis-trans isomerase CWC27 like protein [Eufriesea mexicana]
MVDLRDMVTIMEKERLLFDEKNLGPSYRLAIHMTYKIDIFEYEMKIEKREVDVADKKGLKLNCDVILYQHDMMKELATYLITISAVYKFRLEPQVRLAIHMTYKIDIFEYEMKIEKREVDVADKKGLKLNCDVILYQHDMMKGTGEGKVTEGAIYNMLKLEEALVDEENNVRPLYPPKIRETEILNNPFSDIIPRIIVQVNEEVKDSLKIKTAALVSGLVDDTSLVTDSIILCNEKCCYRDFNLLSFVEGAEEDEEESVILNKKFSDQGNSARGHLSDSKLSS